MKKFAVALFASAFAAVPVLAQEAAPAPAADAAVAAPAAAAPVVAQRGKMLVASGGSRLGAVMRVGADGSPSIIIEGKVVTIPASTLSVVDGKLTTSLTKRQVTALR